MRLKSHVGHYGRLGDTVGAGRHCGRLGGLQMPDDQGGGRPQSGSDEVELVV